MIDSGRLQDEPLPLILHQLHQEKATGVLRIETRVGPHEVYAREGFPVAVKLPGSAEQIGKVLVEMGIIDEDTHKRTVAAPPPAGKRYGDWLVEQNLVSPDHMKLALKAQVRRKLHRLFFLSEGQFKFQGGSHEQGIQKEESLKIHPARAIYQGVRSAWNAERLAGALFLLDGRAIKCTLDETQVARYGVGPDDLKVAELLRKGYWLMPDLVDASGLQLQPVHALVYAFYVTDALDVKGADEVPRLRKRNEASVSAPLPIQVSAPISAPIAVSRTPTPPRGEVQTPVMAASRTPTPPRGEVQTPRTISSSGMPAVPSIEAIRREIDTKSKVVEHEDLFSVLGLTQSATRDQVKNAYFEAAKRYHPDRLTSMGLEALRPEVEKIFRRVSEAYGTLYDDARREDYKKTMGKPKGEENPEAHAKAMKMLEAEMAFRRGEVFLRKNDFVNAIKELEQSVSGNPQEGEHLAWLTWARVCAGQMPWPEAKARFIESTKLSPKCARAFYFVGLAYKETAEHDRALSAFKKAHELDPRLIEAEREMRLINMRKEKEKAAKSSWFGRKK
jgi:tetratricopeptide (TPR) repeat protein